MPSEPEQPAVLYIGAHDVDFFVRAGGTLARYAQAGSRVVAVSLTLGERQESDRLWRERPESTLDEIKEARRAEGVYCAELAGCEFRVLDWDDCPIVFDRERLVALAALIQEVQPRILITHWPEEEVNQDHLVTGRAVYRAVQIAKSAGSKVETGLPAWEPAAIYYSEPWFPFPERSRFEPNVWVDITDLYPLKQQGLAFARGHGWLEGAYGLCAEFRGYQAQRLTGDDGIRYAEAFSVERALVGPRLPYE